MANTYLFSDENGRIPESDIRTFDDVTWVGLNCSLDLLPPGAMQYMNRFSYHTGSAPLKDNGCFEHMEYSLRPDWHQHDLDFRAWIPVKNNASFDDPWYLQPEQEDFVTYNAFDVYVIKEQWRDRFKKDINEASSALQDILSRPPFTSRQPRPANFNTERLHFSRPTKKEIMTLVATARRAMLDHLGFFNWRMTACFQWDRELKNDTVRLLNGYQLERFDKRGILAHLARDWRELSIHFLLSQNVPLLYPWTAKEEVDLRFACLAPSILAAFKERRLNLGNEEAERLPDDIASDPGFHQVFQYSYFLEEQGENYSKPKGGKLTIPKNALAFMKDFRTWSIRPVSTKKERASYLKLYHFGFIDGKAIFWRFRPLALSLEERTRPKSTTGYSEEGFLSDDEDTDAEMETLSQIREQYKGVCAPRPGEKFDLESGKQLSKPYFGNECFERYDAEMLKNLPQSPSSQSWRAAKEIVERVARLMRENIAASMDVDSVGSASILTFPSAPEGSVISFPSSFTLPPSSSSGRESDQGSPSVKSSQLTETVSGKEGMAPPPSLLLRMALPGNYPRGAPGAQKERLVDRLGGTAPRSDFPPPLNPSTKPTLEQRLGLETPAGGNGRRPPSAPRNFSRQQARSSSRSEYEPRPRGRSASPRASTSRGGAARGEQQDSARHPPPRDRSPTPRLNVHVLLSKEEGLRIDAWTDQVLHVMEDQHFAELQKNHLWKPEFLDHAFLLLDTPNARVRFRLLACYSGAKTIGAILNFALLRCIPFRLAVPISSVPVFREARLAPAERALAESYYPVGSGSVPLEYGRNGEGFSERYAVRFLDLLKRPHVRRIASMGGALAWLAWKSGDHLVQDFMNGPSIQVTQYGRGWSDGREANPLFITSDELSPNDLDVLLGHVWDGTTERWVWPSEAILWEYCSFYSGEMTEELDRCLQYILDAEVGKGKAQARTKNGWYQFFRRTARLSAKGKEKDDSKGGDAESRRERRRELEAEFEAQEEKLGSIFKDDWARIRVRDIRLPGICR